MSATIHPKPSSGHPMSQSHTLRLEVPQLYQVQIVSAEPTQKWQVPTKLNRFSQEAIDQQKLSQTLVSNQTFGIQPSQQHNSSIASSNQMLRYTYGQNSKAVSQNGHLIDNVVMILSHKSIKNKKEYLERYAFNKHDSGGCRSLLTTMNKLSKSKIGFDPPPKVTPLINKHPSNLDASDIPRPQSSQMSKASMMQGIPRSQSVSVRVRNKAIYRQMQLQQMHQLQHDKTTDDRHRNLSVSVPTVQRIREEGFVLSPQKKQIFEVQAKNTPQRLRARLMMKKKSELHNYHAEENVIRLKMAIKKDTNLFLDGPGEKSITSNIGAVSDKTENYMYSGQALRWNEVANDYIQSHHGPIISRQEDVQLHQGELLCIKKKTPLKGNPLNYRGVTLQQCGSHRAVFVPQGQDSKQFSTFDKRHGSNERKATELNLHQSGEIDVIMVQSKQIVNSNQSSIGNFDAAHRHSQSMHHIHDGNSEQTLSVRRNGNEHHSPNTKSPQKQQLIHQSILGSWKNSHSHHELQGGPPSNDTINQRQNIHSDTQTMVDDATQVVPLSSVRMKMEEISSKQADEIQELADNSGQRIIEEMENDLPTSNRTSPRGISSQQFSLTNNRTRFYSKPRATLKHPRRGSPQVLNEDIQCTATPKSYQGRALRIRQHVIKQQAFIPQNAYMPSIIKIEPPQILEAPIISQQHHLRHRIELLRERVNDSPDGNGDDEEENAGGEKIDIELRQELALMSNGTLINALSGDLEIVKQQLRGRVQKSGSVCRFSSTMAAQNRVLNGKHIQQKGFQMPLKLQQRSKSREQSPQQAQSSTLDEIYGHHQLVAKVPTGVNNAFKKQQFKKKQLMLSKVMGSTNTIGPHAIRCQSPLIGMRSPNRERGIKKMSPASIEANKTFEKQK